MFLMRAVAVAALLSFSAFAQILPTEQSAALQWRSIGPAATGGRIADIAVSRVTGGPAEVYVATTSGGIFKSANEGVSFSPIFDHAGGMMSMGAIAVAPSNPSIVWAGGGEADNRQSSSWGDGVFKSTDGGAHWQHMGLTETRHIGRIVIHPSDPNIVYVAAVGHLWGSNPERGVYKTTDGGQTWHRVLYRDPNTGAIDLVMDPRDPDVLFAALYQRQRKGWGFNGGGPGSGILRTTDGGATWTELAGGLPRGDKGRIGLAIFAGETRIVYAVVEGASGGVFRSLDQGETWEHLTAMNPRPMYYSRICPDPKDSRRIYLMGSTRGLYISDDGGRSFRDVFSNVHGEDHALWIDPENTNHLIVGGDGGISISFDRGLTWLFRLNLPIGQFYNISVNNGDPFLVCGGLQDNGSWCTPSATRMAHGISFKDAFNVGGGDGMHALFEGDDHTLLVSAQNGSTGRVDLRNMERQAIGPVEPPERPRPGAPAYRWYWTAPLAVSAFDPNTIYTGANVVFRSRDRGRSWQAISSDLTAAIERDTLQMMGAAVPANALSRHDGQANFSALTVVAESPMDRNLLYTGADDGTVQRTRDGGMHWTNLTPNLRGLPPMLNVSGITASKFVAGRVYLTVDGHFDDDYHPYVFVSEDYGDTWRAIVSGLPQASVHRLREHPSNRNVLVAALESGAYVTIDGGVNWTALGADLPPVPVYDLAFQERTGALVAGTHGRGIWVLDHAEPLGQVTAEVLESGGYLFPVPAARREAVFGGQFWFGAGEYFAPNPPAGAVLTYYLPRAAANLNIVIRGATGEIVRTFHGPARSGLNRVCWDLRRDPAAGQGVEPSCVAAATTSVGFPRASGPGPLVAPGRYTVHMEAPGGHLLESGVTVLSDPRSPISESERGAHDSAVLRSWSLQRQLAAARDAGREAATRISAIRDHAKALGDAGGDELRSIDRISADVNRAQGQIASASGAAARVQAAIDAYEGLPTEAQLRELDWAWSDARAAVSILNQAIAALPSVYTIVGAAVKWQDLKPVVLQP
jgi:photosystem II stability/assembly factor-like uncharacterized protein